MLAAPFDLTTMLREVVSAAKQVLRADRAIINVPGRCLHELKGRFEGPIVADVICYLRLNTELALRAKGVLLMRENGFDTPIDEATRAKFVEMRYLEGST